MDRAMRERLINSAAYIITWPWCYHFQCLSSSCGALWNHPIDG